MIVDMQNHNDEPSIRIRIAEYIDLEEPPDLAEISGASPQEATKEALEVAMRFCIQWHGFRAGGELVPEQAVKELIDNLVHAEFKGALISLITADDGEIVRVSDKGPGIADKERAFEIGYSGASPEALQEIRGVGAGLGIARAVAKKAGGTVYLDDNLGGGTVAVVSMSPKTLPAHLKADTSKPDTWPRAQRDAHSRLQTMLRRPVGNKGSDALVYEDDEGQSQVISPRQMHVLMAVFEGGAVGPTAVAERLFMSPSTAYRDLQTLRDKHLVAHPGEFETGKYAVTLSAREVIEEFLDIKDDYAALDEAVTEFLDKVEETN